MKSLIIGIMVAVSALLPSKAPARREVECVVFLGQGEFFFL